MTGVVSLVADVGESFGDWRIGDDAALLEVLSDANIACGFHAGDPRVMDRTVAGCIANGVSIGAHPGFPDLAGFGRRAMDLTRDEVRTDTLYQVGALQAVAASRGAAVRHVTPHGRLGNLVVEDPLLAAGVADAVAALDPRLVVVTQEGELAIAARERALAVGIMFLADRAYENDGRLVSRRLPGAVLHDSAEIADRVLRAVREGVVTSAHGVDIPVEADLVLLHGDEPSAIEHARRLRAALVADGVAIRDVQEVLRGRSTG